MARDRKRAKQRQRRQQALQQRRSTERVPRVYDSPPDPLDHASAEVDIARAAEHGVEPPAPDDSPEERLAAEDAVVYEDELVDADRAPDEAEEYAEVEELEEAEALEDEDEQPAAAAPRRAPVRTARARPAEPREGNRFFNFLRACWAELKRVQWPDRRAVTQATGVVIGFVIIAGAFLGLMDALWSRVVDAII